MSQMQILLIIPSGGQRDVRPYAMKVSPRFCRHPTTTAARDSQSGKKLVRLERATVPTIYHQRACLIRSPVTEGTWCPRVFAPHAGRVRTGVRAPEYFADPQSCVGTIHAVYTPGTATQLATSPSNQDLDPALLLGRVLPCLQSRIFPQFKNTYIVRG